MQDFLLMFSNLNFFLCSLAIPDSSLFKLDLNVEISAFHSLTCKGIIWEICWGLLFMIIFFGENISCFELLVTWVLVQWVHTWFVRKYGVSSFVYFYFHVCFQLNHCKLIAIIANLKLFCALSTLLFDSFCWSNGHTGNTHSLNLILPFSATLHAWQCLSKWQ